MKVLIVEDEATSRILLEKMFQGQAVIETAENGEEAFDRVSEALEDDERFDLICLDVHMPGVSGIEFLTALRQLEESSGMVASEGTKVIMVTGDSDMTTVFDALSQGCTSYLTKPVSRQKFHEELLRLGFIIS